MKTLSQFFALCAPFWFNRRQWREWLFLSAVIGLALLFIQISVRITEWHKAFYDALAAFQGDQLPSLAWQYLGYLCVIVAIAAGGSWLRKMLMFRWRAHLSAELQQAWLSQHRHYHLQMHSNLDNPDQRIAEDAYLLAEKSLDLFKNFVLNVAKLIAFVAILWNMSGVQTIEIGEKTFQIHGYLVWVALGYSVLCTLFTHLIGRKLQPLNIERQHYEADFRTALLRVRDHSEQIAFYHGETGENAHLNHRFSQIEHNWRALIWRELKLEMFSASHLRLSLFIPIFATLPLYLAKAMSFGDLMQARSAFSNVQDGFGWFMDYYKRLMEWAAVVNRLGEFQQALHQCQTPAKNQIEANTPELRLNALTVLNASHQALFRPLTFTAQANQWWLIDGKSGVGKSSLLRVLAGLSPYYQGTFSVCAKTILFLPQHPYLVQGSLRTQLCYPNPPIMQDALLQQVLTQVGLGARIHELDQEKAWGNILSGGEQQRLSLARALLAKPQIVFLDEATNQLDDESAQALMETVKNALPQTLCIGISHQMAVKQLFEQRVTLEN